MKPAQYLIVAISVVSGLGVAYMVAGQKPPEPVRQPAPQRIAMPEAEVLVAARDISFGSTVDADDLRWQSWPKTSVPPGVILRSAMPNAPMVLKGSLSRSNLGPGEPIYQDRLIQPGKSGFMSAILPAGRRAVAINIDSNGSTTAGGFILPNDHVDVIHTFKDDNAAGADSDGMVSETILRNIRVLAIGQNIQEKDKERVVVGSNATLELTPSQVEKIVLAQRVGQLSLSLRSMADTSTTQTDDQPTKKPEDLTIVRFGVPVLTRPH